jgi:hypothetical protein
MPGDQRDAVGCQTLIFGPETNIRFRFGKIVYFKLQYFGNAIEKYLMKENIISKSSKLSNHDFTDGYIMIIK